MKAALRNIPLFAWFLVTLPALVVFSRNVDRLAISWFFWSLAGTAAIYFSGRAVLRLFIRDGEVADLLWAILYVALIAAGFVFPVRDRELVWIVLSVVLLLSVRRYAWVRRPTTLVLTAIAALHCFISLRMIGFTLKVWSDRPAIRRLTASAFDELPAPARSPDPERRDIYYLILDRYARADQLKKLYGYDNESFIRELEARGFSVADKSYANYQRTTHSLISSLNMDYLHALEQEPANSSRDWLPLYEMLQDFRVRRFLHAQGYEFHFFGTWWEPTRLNRWADANHNWRALPEPFRVMLDQSLLPYLGKTVGVSYFDQRRTQCERTKLAFTELGRLTKAGGERKFIFAHLLVPHPPWVMDEKGTCISVEDAKGHTRAQNYVRQLVYANGEVLKFIDAAKSRPGPSPIIIVQSDEGPWPERFAGEEILYVGTDATPADWQTATTAELVEKMAILNALYLPDRDMSGIMENASPVNNFRLVLREYFGVPLEPLPDRQIIFESARRLYRFHDVTERLSGSAEIVQDPKP